MPGRLNRLQRSRARSVLVTLLSLAATAYFGYHVVHGRYGLVARAGLIERSVLLEFEIESLEAARARLARDVALLAPDVPHPDLVEEIARDVLGFARPEDRISIAP